MLSVLARGPPSLALTSTPEVHSCPTASTVLRWLSVRGRRPQPPHNSHGTRNSGDFESDMNASVARSDRSRQGFFFGVSTRLNSGMPHSSGIRLARRG